MILQASISSIKRNTRMLICYQLDKMQLLISEKMWSVHHIIATDVFKEDKEEDLDEAWMSTFLQPCLDIVKTFLKTIITILLLSKKILKTQRSNSNIEKLVEDSVFISKYKYDSCFIWIDVEQSVLNRRVDMRVIKWSKQITLKESDGPSVSLKWTDI
uniref:Uncharacterized protein n=1 Tax=Solanum lycopersicum TaxID=4081 RepID=A0A3Q7HPS4_SOLLC